MWGKGYRELISLMAEHQVRLFTTSKALVIRLKYLLLERCDRRLLAQL